MKSVILRINLKDEKHVADSINHSSDNAVGSADGKSELEIESKDSNGAATDSKPSIILGVVESTAASSVVSGVTRTGDSIAKLESQKSAESGNRTTMTGIVVGAVTALVVSSAAIAIFVVRRKQREGNAV